MPVAFGSLVNPSVGEVVVNVWTKTRMHSNLSNCSIDPEGFVWTAVSVIGVDKGFPVDGSVTLDELDISVFSGLFGSCEGTNSVTVPVTATEFPIAAPAGSGLEV